MLRDDSIERSSVNEVYAMLGSFLTRGLVLAFGYAYPAYECYKTIERNKPEIEHLLFWCQYWILVASLTVFERVGDTFVSWVPMYSEAKLAFFIYLWYPKTKGTTYVYDSFFRPYIAKHENDIDRKLLELRTRAGDMSILHWQRAASYGQTRVFDILQFIASQSTPKPRTHGPPTAVLKSQPPKEVQLEEENKETSSPISSVSLSQDPKEVSEAADASNPTSQAPPKQSMSTEASTEAESVTIESASGNAEPPKETILEETLRGTRGRLRKSRSVPTRKETESTGC